MNARAFLIALAAAGCTSGARVDQPPASTVREPMDTISTLKEVCDLLTRDPLSPAAAREALGRSGTAWVRAGRVIAAADAPEPNHVELDLPSPIALEALARAFGDGHPAPRLHPGDAAEVLYYPAAPDGRQHTCAIIARVGADGVRAVAVRRDPRL
jgi:hypothetical protein